MAVDYMRLEKTAERLRAGLSGIVDKETAEDLASIRHAISCIRNAAQMVECVGLDDAMQGLALELKIEGAR